MTNNSGDKIIRSQVGNVQVSFDKEAAWMRLQDRMESKDEKKGFFRIGWVAAAILLLGCMLWYGLSETKENTLANEKKEIKTLVPATAPLEPAKDETQIVTIDNIAPAAPEKKLVFSTIKKEKSELTPINKEEIAPEEKVIEPPSPMDDAPMPVAVTKPKLEVMHINTVIEEEKRERAMRNSRYAGEKINYDEFFEDPMMPKNPFKIYISRQN